MTIRREEPAAGDTPPARRYEIPDAERARLDAIFTYHPPTGEEQVQRYVATRFSGRKLAEQILEFCPPSRERSLALTKLEEVVMWANAAIAREAPADG